MQLERLKKSIASLGNNDIDFFMQQLENINNKTEIEIVFSGTISNGKSTLINALLGMNLLPMKLGATTSLVTSIQQGKDGIVAFLQNGEKLSYPLSKESIETISKNEEIESIEISMEIFPYHGIRFVDTPGIDDISTAREGRTFGYVPLSDAVIFVVDINKGLTLEEQKFFEGKVVKANKDKIFIVLNKIDTIGEEDINLEKLLSPTIVKEYSIYTISALKYLTGVLSKDEERIAQSGVVKFKTDLDTYLYGLNKKKVFQMRTKKALDSILHLGVTQIDTLLNNVSKDKPQLESAIKEANEKVKQANAKKEILEKEITLAVSEIKSCIKQNLHKLKSDINRTIKDVTHKESMIDKFNDEVPHLCDAMIENIRSCSDAKLNDMDIDFKELDEWYLYIIRNIDDVISQLVWILTLVPKIGKIITPFVPIIQERVRKLVDMFGGKIIQSEVESKVKELLESIEENLNLSISAYQTNLLAEYEHNELGAIRSELLSLKVLLKMEEDKKVNIDYQVQYYKESKNNLTLCINELYNQNEA